MLNRANLRATIFHKEQDYEAFESVLTQAVERFEIHLFSYCLMPNHWHIMVSPRVDGEMGRFAQWLILTHTQRYHAHYYSAGEGHRVQPRDRALCSGMDGTLTVLFGFSSHQRSTK